MADERSDGVQSVILTLRILELLASSREDKGVTEIAKELGTTKARVHRHLQTLCERHYVARAEKSEKYQPGMGIFLLGQLVRDRFGLFAAAKPEMERLRDTLGQTVVLTILVEKEIQVVELVQGTAPIEIVLKLDARFPCHATAQGKVLLAYAGGAAPPALPLMALTDRTITSRAELEAELSRVRARGWATAPGETLDGINAIAAPIFAHDGSIVASLAIVGSLRYVPIKPPPAQIEAVVAAAKRISQTMGWGPAIPR